MSEEDLLTDAEAIQFGLIGLGVSDRSMGANTIASVIDFDKDILFPENQAPASAILDLVRAQEGGLDLITKAQEFRDGDRQKILSKFQESHIQRDITAETVSEFLRVQESTLTRTDADGSVTAMLKKWVPDLISGAETELTRRAQRQKQDALRAYALEQKRKMASQPTAANPKLTVGEPVVSSSTQAPSAPSPAQPKAATLGAPARGQTPARGEVAPSAFPDMSPEEWENLMHARKSLPQSRQPSPPPIVATEGKKETDQAKAPASQTEIKDPDAVGSGTPDPDCSPYGIAYAKGWQDANERERFLKDKFANHKNVYEILYGVRGKGFGIYGDNMDVLRFLRALLGVMSPIPGQHHSLHLRLEALKRGSLHLLEDIVRTAEAMTGPGKFPSSHDKSRRQLDFTSHGHAVIEVLAIALVLTGRNEGFKLGQIITILSQLPRQWQITPSESSTPLLKGMTDLKKTLSYDGSGEEIDEKPKSYMIPREPNPTGQMITRSQTVGGRTCSNPNCYKIQPPQPDHFWTDCKATCSHKDCVSAATAAGKYPGREPNHSCWSCKIITAEIKSGKIRIPEKFKRKR